MSTEAPTREARPATAYQVNPLLHVIRCSDDEVLIRHGARSLYSQVVADKDRNHVLGPLLHMFREPVDLDSLGRRFGADKAEVATTMARNLIEQGVLTPPTPSLTDLYLRTILTPESPPNADERPLLAGQTAVVVGAGPLGRSLGEDLRAAGLGRLRLIDDRAGTSGRYASALGADLEGGGTQVEEMATESIGSEALESAVEDADLLVVAWERFSPSLFHAANEASLAAGVPLTMVHLDGSEAIVGPTVLPGETACYLEYEIQIEASLVQRDAYQLYREHLGDEPDEVAVALPPYARVAAGLAACAILAQLSGAVNPTVNRVVRIDFERFSIDYQEILKLPRCPACALDRPAYRHVFL